MKLSRCSERLLLIHSFVIRIQSEKKPFTNSEWDGGVLKGVGEKTSKKERHLIVQDAA
jgi:hypothetical protein